MVDPTIISRRTLFFVPLALAACKDRTNILQFTGTTMGTTYSIVAVDRDGVLSRSKVEGAIASVLVDVNAQMSNWDAGSEVSRFNANGTDAFAVSPALSEVMAAAGEVKALSDGHFDVAAGGLIDAWGFGAGVRSDALPSDPEITTALATVADIKVAPGLLQKETAETQVYLSSIGKGYGVDAIGAALAGLGVEDFMVEIGGDLVTAGVNPDGNAWQIGVETPTALSGVQQVLGVSGKGLATSGDYRNYFERDGARYSHILDAATGRPITHNTASATVVTENAMLADAWSTAMLILGTETGLALADALDIAVLFIDRDGDSFVTQSSAAMETLTA
ncbi:MAG: FAD:protein FMN transferase [Pseudomonadota bacterium]